MKLSMLLLLGAVILQGKGMIFKIDDFEKPETSKERWVDESNVPQKPTVEFTDAGKEGKHGMKISFHKNGKGGASIAHYLDDKEQWPAEGNVVLFWAKADKASPMRIKLNEMAGAHGTFEGFSAEVNVTTEWKEVRIPLSDFKYLWGHAGGNKKLEPEKIRLIAFEHVNTANPVVFFIDSVGAAKE